MFKVDELVMYGGTGVCKVIEIGRPDFSDDDRLYYFLEPVYQSGMIYAPVDSERVVMRPLISSEEAKHLLDSIDEIHTEIYKTNSMQQLSAHYQKIIDTYRCEDLLSLTKSIYAKRIEALKNNKKLGQIDKRFMKKAEDLLYGEVATALHVDKSDVEEYVHTKLDEI